MRSILTLLVSFFLFALSSFPLVKSVFAKQSDKIPSIQNSSPLYLQHADEQFNKNIQVTAHESHYSHSSHGSHNSHYSHYSSRY